MAETTVVTPSWRLERYRDGDEVEILALFKTVFGKSRSLEHWTWQFKQNPYGGPFVSLARREGDGAVVGSYSVMPVQLNVMGRPVLACQSVDTAVHPDHRGQRIFDRTASDCYAWCQSSGVAAVFGFPNASSYPGFVRVLGWKRILFPTKHLFRLGVRAALRRALGVPLLPEVFDALFRIGRRLQLDSRCAVSRRLAPAEFHTAATVPAGYEGLWNACRSYEILSIWKDAAYMAWRYDRNPDQRFVYLYLSRGGEVPALAVGVDIDGTLTLCELMVAGRDVALGRRLAAEICRYALGAGHRAVAFLGHDAGFAHEALEGFGRAIAHGDVFGGRTFEPGPLDDLLPHAVNWTVTFGDGDFV